MSVTDFIKGLPCHNEKNFSQFNTDQALRISQKRPSAYMPTEEFPSEQHIIMDKRSVLLRYLTTQWDKKTLPRKRDHGSDGPSGGVSSGSGALTGVGAVSGAAGAVGNSCKKRPRLEAE